MGGGKPEKGENNDYDRQFMERGNATHFLSTHTPNKTANAFLLPFFSLEYHFLTFGFRIGKLHNLSIKFAQVKCPLFYPFFLGGVEKWCPSVCAHG